MTISEGTAEESEGRRGNQLKIAGPRGTPGGPVRIKSAPCGLRRISTGVISAGLSLITVRRSVVRDGGPTSGCLRESDQDTGETNGPSCTAAKFRVPITRETRVTVFADGLNNYFGIKSIFKVIARTVFVSATDRPRALSREFIKRSSLSREHADSLCDRIYSIVV